MRTVTFKVSSSRQMPLVEPPLPEMAAPGSKVVATATMYDVDRVGKGTARIYQLPDGRLALRLEDFFDWCELTSNATPPRRFNDDTDEAAPGRDRRRGLQSSGRTSGRR